jgi:hypothetical protein
VRYGNAWRRRRRRRGEGERDVAVCGAIEGATVGAWVTGFRV